MSNYQCHRYHIIFSTKDRQPVLKPEYQDEIWKYLAKTGRENGVSIYEIGGVEDHVHILCGIPASMAVAQFVQLIKGSSSRWMKIRFNNPELAWQSSYASFTSCASLLKKRKAYIQGQREHHEQESFEDEIMRIQKLHEAGETLLLKE